MKAQYIRIAAVKARAKEHGKRCSAEYLLALDDLVRSKIEAACRVHNGGRKTLDATVAGHVS
jgi:hypothetical protein